MGLPELLRDKGSKSIKKKTLLALLKGTNFFSVLSWNNSEFEKITLYPEGHNLALLQASQCVTPVILQFRGLLKIIKKKKSNCSAIKPFLHSFCYKTEVNLSYMVNIDFFWQK